jgi:16S rRNA (adenine1518-N6/adenine1519-N6)-dimethyltransferase
MTGMNLSSPADVAALLKRHRLHPRRRFGQNFLVDANTLAKIVAAAEVGPGGRVAEIGGGLGVLTRALAEAVGPDGRVVCLEVDRDILPALAETVQGSPQVTVVPGDALAQDWPTFLQEHFGDAPVKVVANIPYNITSPLLTTLLPLKGRLSHLVLLVQKEVAQRLAAAPGTSDYGSLSVFTQFHAAVEVVGIVSRRVFLPAPDVDSAIVRLTPHASPTPLADEGRFFAVVRASFGQRRKSLLNALCGDPALGWTREQAAAALERAGIDPQRRGESLSLEEFARLAA